MSKKHNREAGYRCAYVKCPFFRGYGQKYVRCEGFMDGATTMTGFARERDHRLHMDNYCCKNYAYCEIYRMVMEAKYAE